MKLLGHVIQFVGCAVASFFIVVTSQREMAAEFEVVQPTHQPVVVEKIVEIEVESDEAIELRQINEEYKEVLQKLIQLDKINDNAERFLAYKELAAEYPDCIVYDSIYDKYTAEEINYMQRMIETETRGACFEAKVNVANVMFNRVAHSKWPNDPISVITAPRQFAYYVTNISESTILALEYAYFYEDTTQGATSFRSDIHPEYWNNSKLMFVDKAGHGFYTRLEDLTKRQQEIPHF